MIETLMLVVEALLKVIWVANLVHRVLSRGKGSPVRPSRTELLPLLDCEFKYLHLAPPHAP